MGIGRYKNGKFDLILSFRHDAGAARIEQWERSFRRASEILFDATDGQMQFGRFYVARNSAGSDEADAWLLEEEGTSSSSVDALGGAGLHMTLKGDERNKPFVIIHEFGHYGLGLWDEYVGPGGSAAECTGVTTGGTCIMEHGYWSGDQISDDGVLTPGPVNEFCVEENHDPDNDTNQQSLNGEPCWNTIADNYPDVDVPEGLPGAPVPAGHQPVEWILLAEDSRFALVLDRSGSMAASNAINGVRYGSDYWVRFLAETGDSLSVIAYNHAQDVILPLTALSAGLDLASTLTAINAITPSGTTNIGGAMQVGLTQLQAPGNRAATQVMILFSDGLHNTGTSPESVLSDVVENGVRVYTIGFGPYADQVRLQQIAEDTGGRFEQIDAPPDSLDAQLEIQNYLIEISGEVRDGSGIVTMAPGLLPEPEAHELAVAAEISRLRPGIHKDLAAINRVPLAFRPRAIGFDKKAYIEQGCTRATFVVSYKEATRINFYLLDPDGRLVNFTTDQNVRFVAPPNVPYAFYVVQTPQSGYWTMRVMRAQSHGAIPFKVFAFAENRAITIGVKGFNSLYTDAAAVRLSAQVYHTVPLTNLQTPVMQVVRSASIASTEGRAKVGRPEIRSIRSMKLIQRTTTAIVDKVKQAVYPVRLGNGVYRGEFLLTQAGSHSVTMKFVNGGQAVECGADAERTREGEIGRREQALPPFVRIKRFQVHVGPLSAGQDGERPRLDSGVPPTGGACSVDIRNVNEPQKATAGGSARLVDFSGNFTVRLATDE